MLEAESIDRKVTRRPGLRRIVCRVHGGKAIELDEENLSDRPQVVGNGLSVGSMAFRTDGTFEWMGKRSRLEGFGQGERRDVGQMAQMRSAVVAVVVVVVAVVVVWIVDMAVGVGVGVGVSRNTSHSPRLVAAVIAVVASMAGSRGR